MKVMIGNQTETYAANGGDTRYILKAGESIATSQGSGIEALTLAASRTFRIDGSISGATSGMRFAAPDGGDDRVAIGENGLVSGTIHGLYASGYGIDVVNRGTVMAKDGVGIYFGGNDMLLDNSGTIFGKQGMNGYIGGDCRVINSGTISGIVDAAYFTSPGGPGDMLKFFNNGTMTGSGYGFYTDGSTDLLVNKGVINGRVSLGAGDDLFRNSGGHVNGQITGGSGDDIYNIDRATLKIVELTAGGWDVIKVSATWKNVNFVEEVRLTGKKDFKLTGQNQAEELYGNGGDNRIVGGLGADRIDGGGGNDLLIGSYGNEADGLDTFVFRAKCGQDRIFDFEVNADLIDLSGYKGIDEYSDVAGMIRQSGDDVVVRLKDGDRITLLDRDADYVDASDFFFG